MEMQGINKPKLTWSPRIIDELSMEVSSDAIEIFKTQWEYIVGDMSFYMLPYNNVEIERMRNAHFWYSILDTLLHRYSTDQVAAHSGLSSEDVKEIVLESGTDYFPVEAKVGERLLKLHHEVSAELETAAG